MDWIKVIISEMLKGNFSFLILIVGILQLIMMIKNGKKDKKMNKENCCGNCKHYQEAYCNLMDELVEPLDNCGMFDGGEQ